MDQQSSKGRLARVFLCLSGGILLFGITGCSSLSDIHWNPFTSRYPDTPQTAPRAQDYLYIIGPGDTLNIFVWRNPELSTSVPVRPDGRLSVPLLEDLMVTGRTPTELAREIEEDLSVFIQDPFVTVIVTNFVGPLTQQVRIIGAAADPQALPFRANMSLLDVMIEVGGLTEFAAGNKASIVRVVDDEQRQFGVRISDLIKDGDVSANVSMLPGDVLIIPEGFF